MKQPKHYAICKLNHLNYKLKAGQLYEVILEDDRKNAIIAIVLPDYKHIKREFTYNVINIHFQVVYGLPLFFDYFYTQEEYRNIQIDKINET